jgi:SAM-dependent methyltransferase
MVTLARTEARPARASLPTQQIFQRDWQIYRKMIDNNYLFHREAYSCLHHVLASEIDHPFSFLDIACGDASASISALRGTTVAHYEGIDLSRAALDMADALLPELGCPYVLNEGDFAELLPERRDPVDVVWIGLSLHHFQTPEKLRLMQAVRVFLGEGGRFLIYENSSPDGEDREGWMRRLEAQRPFWNAYDDAEWQVVWGHISRADYPETPSTWAMLGRGAGFDRVRELFVAPSDLIRLYSFE